jgi:hypothetical protein
MCRFGERYVSSRIQTSRVVSNGISSLLSKLRLRFPQVYGFIHPKMKLTNGIGLSKRFLSSSNDFSTMDFHTLNDLENKVKDTKDSELSKAYIQNELARRLHSGDGVEKNLKNAASYAQKAAENGLASAQYNFAGMIYTGIGVERDPVRGLEWYRRYAARGQFHPVRKSSVPHVELIV